MGRRRAASAGNRLALKKRRYQLADFVRLHIQKLSLVAQQTRASRILRSGRDIAKPSSLPPRQQLRPQRVVKARLNPDKEPHLLGQPIPRLSTPDRPDTMQYPHCLKQKAPGMIICPTSRLTSVIQPHPFMRPRRCFTGRRDFPRNSRPGRHR